MKLELFPTQGPNSPRKPLARCLSACVAALSLATAVAQASMPGTTVGEVSIVIGKAWIEKPGAGRQRVTDGTQVGVFDKIETDSDGHVHIRFVDGGLFSIRPYSTLEIERYDYNAANPEASAVKLNVLEGEARSISGEAAHKARENYRINTPIAAIGVRGTDFVINADRREFFINEGAIVVAPFSSQCLAASLNPCNANGQELAYGASQMLQLASDGSNVVLLPASDLPASLLSQSPSQQQPPVQVVSNVVAAPQAASGREERSGGELYTESVTALAVTRTLATKPATPPNNSGGTPPVPLADPEFTPDALVSALTLQNSSLLWARAYDPARPHDRITVPLDQALAINTRKGAVSTPSYSYVLFRQLSDMPRVQPDLGIVGFGLNSAQAMYTSNGVVELLDVNKGLLSINFNDATFATSLAMRSATLGAVDFSANGRVLDGGFFQAVGANQEMAGAVTFDGKEAGYYFDKKLDTGTLEGLTLWGRQP